MPVAIRVMAMDSQSVRPARIVEMKTDKSS